MRTISISLLLGIILIARAFGAVGAESKTVKINPSEVLEDGKFFAASGKYGLALKKYVWYHNHALKYDPSSKWMRLSVALGLWIDLGRKYPPAMQKLRGVRDSKTAALLNKKGNFLTFNDVSAINQALGQSSHSVDLFIKLDQKQPMLAKECWGLVKNSMIRRQHKQMLNKYLKNIYAEFEQIKFVYEQLRSADVSDRDEIKKYAEKSFVKRVCELIDALKVTGRAMEARKVCRLAQAVVNSPELTAVMAVEAVK
ncbi:MAG: hypothetical protein GY750_07745 [Lentisphaerae bacterium]|nr:hypothetical protein [Lentisphaerota bacterium]MCP4101299.1 hypothetical protein [Lentisphaerota bacterium]